MSTIAQVREQRDSGLDIQSVVKTMKAFAAVHIRQYQKAEAALNAYAGCVESALAAMARGAVSDPETIGRGKEKESVAYIVFGSDQGLVGRFNECSSQCVIDAVKAETRPVFLCAVGARLLPHLEGSSVAVHKKLSMPLSPHALESVLSELLLCIDEWRTSGRADRIVLVYSVPHGAGGCRALSEQVLPPSETWLAGIFSKAKETPVPVYVAENPDAVSEAIIRQYITISFSRAFAVSLACENAMRLAAMQQAENHIEEFLDELTLLYNQERQNDITGELLDIVGGAEALAAGVRGSLKKGGRSKDSAIKTGSGS